MANEQDVVQLPLTSCMKCPNMDKTRVYTEDSWEEPYKISCKKVPDKIIAGFFEWHDPIPEIPQWCPLRNPT